MSHTKQGRKRSLLILFRGEHMSIKSYRMVLTFLLILSVGFGGYYIWNLMKNGEEESQAVMEEVEENMVIPGGMPVGFYLQCNGVMITGTEKIKTENGVYEEPAKHLVKAGDYIVGINDEAVE